MNRITWLIIVLIVLGPLIFLARQLLSLAIYVRDNFKKIKSRPWGLHDVIPEKEWRRPDMRPN